MKTTPGSTTGVGAALARVSGAAAQLLTTRVELAAVELAQARQALVRWFGLALAAAVLMLLALASATAALAAALWPALGWISLAGCAAVYGVATALLAWRIRRELREAPVPFDATVAELRRDLELLKTRRQAADEHAP
jgi:uncharacterized membrane protein YqjE